MLQVIQVLSLDVLKRCVRDLRQKKPDGCEIEELVETHLCKLCVITSIA